MDVKSPHLAWVEYGNRFEPKPRSLPELNKVVVVLTYTPASDFTFLFVLFEFVEATVANQAGKLETN